MTGTVKRVNVDKGYGFIQQPGGPDLFFHCSQLADGLAFDDRLIEMRISFDILTQSDGRTRAVNVRPSP